MPNPAVLDSLAAAHKGLKRMPKTKTVAKRRRTTPDAQARQRNSPLTELSRPQDLEYSHLHRATFPLATVFVIATLVLYLPVIHHDFLISWDDAGYVSNNAHVTSGLSLSNVAWAFTGSGNINYWQPLTYLSHMAVCQFFGLNAGIHLYVNVIIHAANAVLLLLLLCQATGSLARSSMVSALFALHPMNVESVAWVAERNNLLSAFFSLLTLAAYGRYVQLPGWRRYLVVMAGFSLALMAKPAAMTLPLVLLFCDYWPLNRCAEFPVLSRLGRLVKEKIPLAVMSLCIFAFTFLNVGASNGTRSFKELPMSLRIENALISYAAYIGDLLWPAHLLPYYPHPAYKATIPISYLIWSTFILAAITASVLYFRRARFTWVGWVFYLATLLPMSGFVQAGYVGRADRFLYIPGLGLLVLLVWGTSEAMKSMNVPRAIPLAVSLVGLVASVWTTARYLPHWTNSVELFAYARTTYQRPSQILETLYGDALRDAGRKEEALEHFKQSCAISKDVDCLFGSAEIEFERRDFAQAEHDYAATLMLTRDPATALTACNKAAESLLELGNPTAAERAVTWALSIDPGNADALRLRERIRKTGN
jgi:hypothetical protein